MLLAIHNLAVRYGSILAVKDLSVTVEKGEVVGLVGPNGAGKSSTLLAIAGAVRGAGRVIFDGEEITRLRPEAIVRRGISLVPETRDVFSRLSVLENLQIGATTRKSGPDVQRDRDRIMAMFPILAQRAGQPAGQLSGGEQQMLAIGRALMAAPKLLMLDEPSLGLAPAVTDTLYRSIGELAGGGLTILLVEQNVRRVQSVCQRLYLLSAGALRSESVVGAAMEEHHIEAAYFGSDKTQAGRAGVQLS